MSYILFIMTQLGLLTMIQSALGIIIVIIILFVVIRRL